MTSYTTLTPQSKTPPKTTKKKKEQKYIVDFGNQVYGSIVTVGNRKEMYRIASYPPGQVIPNEYTFDEITETDLFDYSTLKPVDNL